MVIPAHNESAGIRRRLDALFAGTMPNELDVVADDLWVDGQFASDEIEIVECVPVVAAAPLRARDLFGVLRRTYRDRAETAGVDPHARLAVAGPSSAVRCERGDSSRTGG